MYQNNGGGLPRSMADNSTSNNATAGSDARISEMSGIDMALSRLDHESQNAAAHAAFASYAPQQQADASDAYSIGQENTMTRGAGPPPTGFGTNPPGGSILTEFTKRRNWSQRVLEDLQDLLHILTPDGRFLFASPSCKTLTGWEPLQLVGRPLQDFVHPEDREIFTQEFNESITSGNPLRFFYRFRKADETCIIFEAHGHPHITTSPTVPFAPICRGFFLIARPYPTKNASLLDSFLEHKIENERLMKRIAELKREEQEELADQDSQYTGMGDAYSSAAGSETADYTSQQAAAYGAMPPPAKPSVSNSALTQQNLSEAMAAAKPDSMNEKMARYEGTNHLETIEMLTGLRYRDGERSQGISTGDASPLLIRGDAGIQISLDREVRHSSDRKKKMKIADEYVCTDCGTLDSPEWRKGPSGPKTLCNACGLRWAKKEKKRQSRSGEAGAAPSPALLSSNSS